VTLKKIAEVAGVGSATVERVLNGRGGVRPALVEKVVTVARQLDYFRRLPAPHRGLTRIEVLMLRPELSFVSRLSASFERIAASLDNSIVVHRTFMDESNPGAVAELIAKPKLQRSALIVLVHDHPAIHAALAAEQAKGLPIVQLVSPRDLPDPNYVGIDNQAAGRMAGVLMVGLQRKAGTVVGLCHSQIYGVHRARMAGFSQVMATPKASHLNFTLAAFTQDNDMEAGKIVSHLLRSTPDLVGIYSAGGDYGPTCDVLRRMDPEHALCFIGHELSLQSSAALKDGTITAIIDQAPETQARRALDLVLSKLDLLSTPVDTNPIRFVTIISDSV
jgi:LacI family transcriptional regulator